VISYKNLLCKNEGEKKKKEKEEKQAEEADEYTKEEWDQWMEAQSGGFFFLDLLVVIFTTADPQENYGDW